MFTRGVSVGAAGYGLVTPLGSWVTTEMYIEDRDASLESELPVDMMQNDCSFLSVLARCGACVSYPPA
jgi:hypothetical protein